MLLSFFNFFFNFNLRCNFSCGVVGMISFVFIMILCGYE